MEPRPDGAVRWWIVRILVVAAWAVFVRGLLAEWYTSTRVDLDPDRVRAHLWSLLVVGPLVGATASAAARVAFPPLASVGLALTALPGLAVLYLGPGVLEASTTDTTFVLGPAPSRLTVSVVVATVALVAASVRVRTPAAGWSG